MHLFCYDLVNGSHLAALTVNWVAAHYQTHRISDAKICVPDFHFYHSVNTLSLFAV